MNARQPANLNRKPAQGILEPRVNGNGIHNVGVDKHYFVQELAERWQQSENTIGRMFENEPGVSGGSESRFKGR